MTSVTIEDFASWRSAARKLLANDVPPEEITWSRGLFDEPLPEPPAEPIATVPRDFLDLATTVALHRDERRWELLYRTLLPNHSWRAESFED